MIKMTKQKLFWKLCDKYNKKTMHAMANYEPLHFIIIA